MMNEVKRDVTVDILKGLGIILMVAGHGGMPFIDYVYLFHMALFFIASGYCYNTNKTNNFELLVGYGKRKIKTIWLPYFVWTTIFTLLHNVFLKINIYTNDPVLLEYVSGDFIELTNPIGIKEMLINIAKAVVMHGGTQMGGAFWFLITLFELSIFYAVVDYLVKKIWKMKYLLRIQTILAIVFLMAGYACHLLNQSLFGMNRVLSYYSLFQMGVLLKNYGISSKKRKELSHILILVCSAIIIYVCRFFGTIALDWNKYGNPVFLLVTSLAGWAMMYELAYQFSKWKGISRLLVIAGQNTLSVVILHFLCFKIVSFLGVIIKGEPKVLVAAFPILYKGGIWWIAYLMAGLVVPIVLSIMWKRIVNYSKK